MSAKETGDKFVEIKKAVIEAQSEHIELLKNGLAVSFLGIDEFQEWVKKQYKLCGLAVEEFKVKLEDLKNQPAFNRSLKLGVLKEAYGTNVIGKWESGMREGGILLFAHADKAPDTYQWGKVFDMKGCTKSGSIYGPGIADDVSGITACISAIHVCKDLNLEPTIDVRLASVLGKQLGVFGTYGLVTQYSPSCGVVYVHPPASGGGLHHLIIAALGIAEFVIQIKGKQPETMEPWKTIFGKSGINSIIKGIEVIQKLQEWSACLKKTGLICYPEVEAVAGESLVCSIGRFIGGENNQAFHIPLFTTIEGVIHFPPRLKLYQLQEALEIFVKNLVAQDPWFAQGNLCFSWGDVLADGFDQDPSHPFISRVKKIVQAFMKDTPEFYYGHSVSDLRYPVLWWNVPSVGLGPKAGNIGTPEEYIDQDEYLNTIAILAALISETNARGGENNSAH